MLLKGITPQYFGPFYEQCNIELADDITIFTGANDCGKTFALQAIDRFCNLVPATEEIVNIDRYGEFGNSWQNDDQISLQARLQVQESDTKLLNSSSRYKVGDIAHAYLSLSNTDNGAKVTHIKRENNRLNGGYFLKRESLPSVVYVFRPESISDVIDLAKPNSTESLLLKIAFGSKFTSETLSSVTENVRETIIARGERQINAQLHEALPSISRLEFKLRPISGKSTSLACHIIDDDGGFTPLSARGAGIRRVAAILCHILSSSIGGGSTLALLDEPEVSLHADAQHQLRDLLLRLAAQPNIQIVYATHSPAMIPSHLPDRIRIFERSRGKRAATSRVSNSTYGENFQKVRISLGLTPGDSLLYGSVTVIVEGDTEVRCLEKMILKVARSGEPTFKGVEQILDSVLFVSGEGNNIPKYCRIALAQNANPIVLVDSDKKSICDKVHAISEDVPVIVLNDGEEFENLIPLNRYIQALDDLAPENRGRFTLEEYEAWSEDTDLPDQMMISKRVSAWAREALGSTPSKHELMDRAIELSEPDEISVTSLLKLVASIREAL